MLKVLQFKLIFLTRGTVPTVTDGVGGGIHYPPLPNISSIFKKKISKNFCQKIFLLKNLHMSKIISIFAPNFINRIPY